jgi:predicted alpha/beta-fold hydrolase
MPFPIQKKRQREAFYNMAIPRILKHPTTNLIMSGNFNCVLTNTDCTGTPTTNSELTHLINCLDLHESWEHRNNTRAYTHYTSTGASGTTEYLSRCLLPDKKTTELRAAAFTSHYAVILNMAPPTNNTTRGRGYWKLNASLLQDQQMHATFRREWDL